MKVPETAFKLALFGMKHETDDIIDYAAIPFSVLIRGCHCLNQRGALRTYL